MGFSLDSSTSRYWGETQCDDFSDPSTDETSELMLESAAGMFFVLIGGVVLGAIALAFERLLRRLRIIKPKVSRTINSL